MSSTHSDLHLWRVATVTVFVIIAFTVLMVIGRREPVETLLRKGQQSFVKGDFQQAAEFAGQILEYDPQMTEALHLAGRCSMEQRNYRQALEYFDRIGDETSIGSVQARCIAGDLLMLQIKHLSAAEDQFHRALFLDPKNELANDRMAYLLGLSVRSWEATRYRLQTLKDKRASREQLFVLALGDLARENPNLVEEFHKSVPDDAAVQVALAVQAIDRQEYSQAKKLLHAVIQKRPLLITAHVRLGQLLLATNQDDEFLTWHRRLPKHADSHPAIWAILGQRARRNKQERIAVRCLWESVRLDPNVPQTNYQLAQALIALKRSKKAEPFLDRADRLQNYLYHAHTVHAAKPKDDGDELLNAAIAAEALGLQWEALSWARVALLDKPGFHPAQQLIQRISPGAVEPPFRRCHPDYNPALHVDFSDHPSPNWNSRTTVEELPETAAKAGDSIRFENQAKAAGIDFQYFNGGNPDELHVVPLHEQTGGGIAALDYDADGWPDLYFTQGCPWPPSPGQSTHIDRLYRNSGDGKFDDVTANAGLNENGFSQGVAIGDFNNDGFPDLYVGNIGINRLFMNNGDGTFEDVTDESQTGGDAWTTSCVICDLNGDAMPDIYAVNYLSADDLFTRRCYNPDGSRRPCRIQSYEAAQDRLYLNLGNGTFADVTAKAGIRIPGGRGLGIVAADFDNSGQLDLYVANDVSPNFLFVNEAPRGADVPRFAERGILTGAAASENGAYEAGMGIAVGDSDGDGRLDLFVTNFERESNTLYRLEANGLFTDVTWQAQLGDPSFNWLGFGTQFLDADRDGDLDLVLANGHVDDVRNQNRPYRMPPQFFANQGNGRFDEVSPESLGSYFEGKYLGRALMRLDWNRDGLEDIVVSHLDAPAALLSNTTATENAFLAIKFYGVTSGRDGIGTTAVIELDDGRLLRQLTAGDGFHASNQRMLLFGIPKSTQIRELQINWPSGTKQSFTSVPINCELLVIEGRSAPFMLEWEQ